MIKVEGGDRHVVLTALEINVDVLTDFLNDHDEEDSITRSGIVDDLRRTKEVRDRLQADIDKEDRSGPTDSNGTMVLKGDIVTIFAQGIKVTGRAVYTEHYDHWDIEMVDCDIPGGYSHWKQAYDKGVILKVNDEVIINR